MAEKKKEQKQDDWSVTSRVVGPMFKSFPKPTKKKSGKK